MAYPYVQEEIHPQQFIVHCYVSLLECIYRCAPPPTTSCSFWIRDSCYMFHLNLLETIGRKGSNPTNMHQFVIIKSTYRRLWVTGFATYTCWMMFLSHIHPPTLRRYVFTVAFPFWPDPLCQDACVTSSNRRVVVLAMVRVSGGVLGRGKCSLVAAYSLEV